MDFIKTEMAYYLYRYSDKCYLVMYKDLFEPDMSLVGIFTTEKAAKACIGDDFYQVIEEPTHDAVRSIKIDVQFICQACGRK